MVEVENIRILPPHPAVLAKSMHLRGLDRPTPQIKVRGPVKQCDPVKKSDAS